MRRLTVNEDKCKKDGFCVADCPVGIVRLEGDGGYPSLVPGREDLCLDCGHCVAVCPHGALSHSSVPVEECPPVSKQLAIGEAQAVQFLRSRRSIRAYTEKPVEREKIRKLIEIASWAPTGSNTQLVEWLVFTDRDKIRELAAATVAWMKHALRENPAAAPYFLRVFTAAWDAGQDLILRDAPALVVAIAPEPTGNGIVDPTIALSYLELAAPTMGLGTCWAGALRRALLNWEPARAAAGLPEGYPFYYPMMLGYPRFRYHRMPKRNAPKISWR